MTRRGGVWPLLDEARDIWRRMALLDRRCLVELHGVRAPGDDAEGALRWRAEVRPRPAGRTRGEEPIVVEGETALAALLAAVRCAEGRGWHLDPSLPPGRDAQGGGAASRGPGDP